jgi:hypothetical protein
VILTNSYEDGIRGVHLKNKQEQDQAMQGGGAAINNLFTHFKFDYFKFLIFIVFEEFCQVAFSGGVPVPIPVLKLAPEKRLTFS